MVRSPRVNIIFIRAANGKMKLEFCVFVIFSNEKLPNLPTQLQRCTDDEFQYLHSYILARNLAKEMPRNFRIESATARRLLRVPGSP